MLSLITLVVTSVLAGVAVAQAPNATFPPAIITQVTGEVDLTTRSKSYLSVLSWACPVHTRTRLTIGHQTHGVPRNTATAAPSAEAAPTLTTAMA